MFCNLFFLIQLEIRDRNIGFLSYRDISCVDKASARAWKASVEKMAEHIGVFERVLSSGDGVT